MNINSSGLDALAQACKDFVDTRWPDGERGGAAMLLGDGSIVYGTSPDMMNPAIEVCHEMEPFAAAFRLQQSVIASICLHKASHGRFLVLSPCGVCRERLAIHGPEVQVAVAANHDATKPLWKPLGEVLPDYWLRVLPEELPPGW